VNFRKVLPTFGEISQLAAKDLRRACGQGCRNRAIPPFPRFGTPRAKHLASADVPPDETRGNEMIALSNYAQHAFAAIGALAISALLFTNTLATQAAEVHSVAGILA
jgi:hypothetical protein